ncbi:MAG: type II secretion system protein [Kiritimatiellae bacterium]|nr:type II secretion system protein [Kiritimatiellia bacterium]
MKNIHSRNAFTLIEMLIVIGIIAVLTGASLAGFSKMRETAERAKAQELVSNVATALTALFQQEGSWPKRLAANGANDGELDAQAAFPLAKKKYLSLTLNSDGTALDGLDKLGIVDPWGAATIKRRGRSASLSDKVAGSVTVQDHILHYALDLDGDGIVEASVGGEPVTIRASAAVWGAGKDGKLEAYTRGLKKDDVYSWAPGMAKGVR